MDNNNPFEDEKVIDVNDLTVYEAIAMINMYKRDYNMPCHIEYKNKVIKIVEGE